jgi:hypothetical protein
MAQTHTNARLTMTQVKATTAQDYVNNRNWGRLDLSQTIGSFGSPFEHLENTSDSHEFRLENGKLLDVPLITVTSEMVYVGA